MTQKYLENYIKSDIPPIIVTVQLFLWSKNTIFKPVPYMENIENWNNSMNKKFHINLS